MRVLMFGWEFPPVHSGGLGVACQGIAEGLISNGQEVFMVLPKVHPAMHGISPDGLELISAKDSGAVLTTMKIPSTLYSPYASHESYQEFMKVVKKQAAQEESGEANYGDNLMEEIYRYASQAAVYANKIDHDIIHTHDWLTAEAGIQAARLSEKPHVMHVHATEFDRSGESPNQEVYDMERRGMHKADHVIAVSEYTKKMLIKHYGVPEWKIDVVYNAVKPTPKTEAKEHHLSKTDQIVLFLGRMTMQKGPDYFLQMAKKVLERKQNVKFIMAGDGNMMEEIIEMATKLGIERNVLFAGFLTGDEVERAYANADLYVMPSTSEPFGIAPLEAIKQGTPVLISKQAGVSEVIKNALVTDFWDIDDMASKTLAVLDYPALGATLSQHATREVDAMHWAGRAADIVKTYQKIA